MFRRFRKEPVLLLLLIYVIGLSSTIGSICYLDVVKCGKTGDTREWLLQLISIIVSLMASARSEKE